MLFSFQVCTLYIYLYIYAFICIYMFVYTYKIYVYACVLRLFSHVQLFANPWTVLFQILSHYRLLQNTEYSSVCYTVDSYCLSIFYCCCSLPESRPTLCNPMDCSLPGSSVQGVFPDKILEWGAISYSRGSSRPRDWTRVSCTGRWVLYCGATREALCMFSSPFPSLSTPPPVSPLAAINLFSTSVSLFLFCK